VEEYSPYLHTLAASLLDPGESVRHDADDLAQETSLKAFLAFEQFAGATEAEFKGWLASILRNVLASKRRTAAASKRGGGKVTDVDPETLERWVPNTDPSPSSMMRFKESVSLLQQALDGLSDQQRHAVRLKFFEGLSHQEVGQKLHVSPEAARKLCDRGLANLRERLRDLMK
jgi:RNA polymerase sigma-70 factor (ECF subfamily)